MLQEEHGAPKDIRFVSQLTAALALAKGSGTSYSDRLNDQWNIAGIKSNDGYPSITSHYGYHMTSWHLVFALSGQLADLSDPANSSLTFAPKFSGSFSSPVFLPGIVGILQHDAGGFQLALSTGQLRLHHLSVNGYKFPAQEVTISPTHPARW